jgi:hypothetical protein
MTDLKTATPDTSFPVDGYLFGADSQAATTPSIYTREAVRNAILPINLKTETTGPLVTPGKTLLTIDAGVITVTSSFHRVDTETQVASDDIDTISGGVDGHIVILRAESGARTVVIKNGTGNIVCGGDVTLDNEHDTATLIYDGDLAKWLLVASSSNGA